MRIALSALASLLFFSAAAAAGVNAETGTRDGASYRIDVPEPWNHELIVFYHGYSTRPLRFAQSAAISPMFQPMLDKGYAVLQSGYSAGGWAVEQAYADTENLRKQFEEKHGAAKQNWVMGMSMGGTLTVLTIESKPDVYAGALSLCGAIEPSDRLVQRDLALRAAFDFYFPDVLPAVTALREPSAADERNIIAALAAKPAARQALLRWYASADENNFPGVILFAGYEIAELMQRAHGMPVGNADLIYTGSGDDAALNAGVHRYRADAGAAQYLARWYTPTGKLLKPLLALHDSGDPLVPAASANEYALAVSRTGHGNNFVQQYVNREGHCVFTPQEIGQAFDELIAWTHAGRRPKSGRL
jgi:pimeloyl-ACP methyl ester carboxylesterase